MRTNPTAVTAPNRLDWTKLKKVHFVGIKGVALAALAQCLNDVGIIVTGSDIEEEFVTQEVLHKREFLVHTNFSAGHITSDTDLVVYTGAHQGRDNIEVQRAIELGISVASHAEALGQLMDTKKSMSICGTGGKSTTSAMIAWTLEYAGARPSFAVGVGNIKNLGCSGRFVPDSEWFVAEADEYAVDPTCDLRPRFIYQHPHVIVCSNLSYDHPDIYPTFDDMKQTFLSFFNCLPMHGTLIVNGDNHELVELLPQVRGDIEVIRVGLGSHNDVVISHAHTIRHRNTASVRFNFGELLVTPEHAELSLKVPGMHNIFNASLTYAAVGKTGTAQDIAREGLNQFAGTMRRFEYVGQFQGAPCYDDYAHTPDEIAATLTALSNWEPDRRIVAAFQPHTFSRTRALFDGFVQTLTKADEVVLVEIFPSAREAFDPRISSQMLGDRIKELAKGKKVHVVATIDGLADVLRTIVRSGDTLITMGAGDIYKVFERLKMET